ncbi:hypothetical protein [Photobacterium sp. DNB22_13_2]
MKLFKSILLSLLSLVSLFFSYSLFLKSKLTAPEFISLFIVLFTALLIIFYISELDEISIGKSTLKFKEIKQEAIDAIKALQDSRVSNFRFLLSLIQRDVGDYDDIAEGRFDDFQLIYDEIVNTGSKDRLVNEINITSKKLLLAQLYQITNKTNELVSKYNISNSHIIPSPDQLTLDIGSNHDEILSKLNEIYTQNHDLIPEKQLELALHQYRYLHDIYIGTFTPPSNTG